MFDDIPNCTVLVDPSDLSFFGGDIMGEIQLPVAVLQPHDQDALSYIVKTCRAQKIAVCTRGGGASYTHAHVPKRENSIVIDTSKLNRIIEINAEDMTVTVEPGVTWKQLNDALVEQGLRTPFWGPFSGLKSTIGGALSQHAISLGSGQFEVSNSSVTGLKIVTGTGEVIDTGSTSSRFFRAYGPDLTALFLGESGAFGIKIEITLRLISRPKEMQTACFAYGDFESMVCAMREVSKRNIASEIVALDPELQKGQFGTMKKTDFISTALSILKGSPNLVAGLSTLIRAAFTSRSILKKSVFVVMYVVEGHSRAEAKAKVATLRTLAKGNAAEIANAMAIAMRSHPFIPFTPLLSPKGERWMPMHGILPYSKIKGFHAAYKDYLEAKKAEMEKHAVRIAHMFVTVGQNGFIYEPAFYWPDSQNAVHIGLMPEEYRLSLPENEENPEAREFVFQMKDEVIALMQEYGAAHFQVGKCYPYMSNREPGAKALLTTLKKEFDPDNIINPGVLEF